MDQCYCDKKDYRDTSFWPSTKASEVRGEAVLVIEQGSPASVQRYRASGLNLVTPRSSSGTVNLERATQWRRAADGGEPEDALLRYLSPLGWEHINLTGDYLRRNGAKVGAGGSGRFGH